MGESIPLSQTPDQPLTARLLGSEARKVLVLVNRKAGAGRGRAVVDKVAQSLSDREMAITVITDIEELRDTSRSLLERGELRAVVSAGGDGTICAALNATPLGTPLAVLPLGTENLLARYLRHRRTTQSIVELLTEGVVVPMDAATANGRLFAIVFSAGLDAEVVRQVHENRRGNITHLAYAGPLLRAIGAYRFPKIKVTAIDPPGAPFSASGCWSFGVNLPMYALQLPLAPQAVGNDGLLDMCVLERGSLVSGLWYLMHVVRGRHHLLDTVHTTRGASFHIESVDGYDVPYQVDGDPGGVLPVEVSSLPGRMHLVVTRAVAKRLGFEAPAERD